MRFFDNNSKNPDAYYEPSNHRCRCTAMPIATTHRDGNDDYSQAGNLFHLFNRVRRFSSARCASPRRSRGFTLRQTPRQRSMIVIPADSSCTETGARPFARPRPRRQRDIAAAERTAVAVEDA